MNAHKIMQATPLLLLRRGNRSTVSVAFLVAIQKFDFL